MLILVAAAAGVPGGWLVAWLAERLPPQPSQLSPEARQLRQRALLVTTPLLFALLAWRYDASLRLPLAALYAALFLLIAVIDLEHRLVLNRMLLPAMLLAPLAGLLWGLSLESMALGTLVLFGFFLLSALLSRGGVAGGDVKLALLLGLLTGFPGAVTALFYTALIAGVTSGGLLLARKRGRKDYIPFAPFMVAGAALALWAGG